MNRRKFLLVSAAIAGAGITGIYGGAVALLPIWPLCNKSSNK